MSRLNDIQGRQFGRLTAIARRGLRHRKAMWLCRCVCGSEREFQGSDLVRGRTQSCGCIGRERSTTHGSYGSAEYNVWASMVQRCLNPKNDAFPRYGGRGITVCERWRDFANFFADMGPRPPGLTLERTDNARGYEPGNCVWATHRDQSLNRRSNVVLTHAGRSMTARQWADERGLSYTALVQRIRAGWPASKALETPLRGS